jgi:hypothetical protein
VGAVIVAHGLQSEAHAHLNGQPAKVIGHSSATGRVCVRFADGREAQLRPHTIRLATAAETHDFLAFPVGRFERLPTAEVLRR